MRAVWHRSRRSSISPAAFAALLALWPASALADMGLPMLAVVWPASWILLIPVVLIEGAVARSVLSLPLARCLKVSFVANLVSTAIGIPLAWLAALMVQLLLAGIGVGLHEIGGGHIPEAIIAIQAISPAWIGPFGNSWTVPAASLALCVPFFFASVYIERRVARIMVVAELHDRIRVWSWRANIVSYSAIGVVLLVITLVLLMRR